MVGNVAGVVEVVASVVGVATDVDEEVIGADRIYASSVVMAMKLLKLTVNVKSPAMAAKSGMMAILFVWEAVRTLLGILNIITKSRLSSLNLVTVPKMPNLSLTPLKPICHPQHDMRDAVLKYAIALLNK